MPLLVPNSYGSAADGRVLREYNPNHEPAGSSRGGGRFAPAPGGGASRAGETPKKIKKIELQGTLPGSPFNAALAKEVLGRTMTEAQVGQLAEDMLRDTEGVSFNVKVSTKKVAVYDDAGKSTEKSMVVLRFVGEDGDPSSADPAKQPTSLVRAFFRDGGKLIVQHNAFEKNRALPAGFGKDVLRSHMLTYEALGVDRIETHANIDVGAYAWAKYGFAATNPGELGRSLEKLVDKWHGRTVTDRDFVTGSLKGGRGVAVDDSVAHELQRIAASPSKTKIWEFADLTIDGVKVGKTILTDVDQFDGWGAFLNVKGHDAFSMKQRQRFWGYVGRTKQPNVGGRPKTREAMVVLYEVDRPAKPAGELCEWDGRRYSDRRIWDAMLNGDAAHFYELRDPAARAAYRGQLPQG